MTSQLTAAIPAASDPAFAEGVVFAVAAGFFAVAIHYYLRLTHAAERLLVKRTRKRLHRSARLLSVRHVGRALWLTDVACVIGLRAVLVLYLGVLWFLLVPVLMTVGSITLAASIIASP